MSDLAHKPTDQPPGRPTNRSTGPSTGGAGARIREILRAVPGPAFGLIAIVIVLSFLSPYFLTARNLTNIISQVSDIGIMAVGAALVIFIGGIDLSVGSTVALSLMTMAYLNKMVGVPFPLALLASILVGAIIGTINGFLSTVGRIQPFVATLATMSAAAGLALFITNGNPINGFPDWFLWLTSGKILGLPVQGIILILVYLLAAFWLRYRPTGRAIYAVGGNEEVARLSGLNVTSIKITVYVLSGLLAAIAGQLISSRLNSAQPTAGTADLLNVIAVVVIGGASLSGGSGSMLGTFIGLLIIGTLNNGMSLLNVSPNLQPVVIGIAIIAAVMTDRRGRQRAR